MSTKSMRDVSILTISPTTDYFNTCKLTRLASPPLSPVKIIGRPSMVGCRSTHNVSIFAGRVRGCPLMFFNFFRRLSSVSREAVDWKKF